MSVCFWVLSSSCSVSSKMNIVFFEEVELCSLSKGGVLNCHFEHAMRTYPTMHLTCIGLPWPASDWPCISRGLANCCVTNPVKLHACSGLLACLYSLMPIKAADQDVDSNVSIRTRPCKRLLPNDLDNEPLCKRAQFNTW